MLSEQFIKKLTLVWVFIILTIITLSVIDFPFLDSKNSMAGIYFLIIFASFLGWYLLFNFIFSNLAPSFVKSYSAKNSIPDFGLLLVKFIVTKEAFQLINQCLSMHNKGSSHE